MTSDNQEPALRSLPDLIQASANPDCGICFGSALVCEAHPKRPWASGTSFDCYCGEPGRPCFCTGLESADG